MTILSRWLFPDSHDFEHELQALQSPTFLKNLAFCQGSNFSFTSQCFGQGKSLQLCVPSRTGQDAPPCSGGVTTALPLRLFPGPPQLQDLEQELQELQALTWEFCCCYAFTFHGVLPCSWLDRGSHCNSLWLEELGKVFHWIGVESRQPCPSDFVQSCTSWSRSSTGSKPSPKCAFKIKTFLINLPCSQLGRESRYKSLFHQELGKMHRCMWVGSQCPFLSFFVQDFPSGKIWNSCSIHSKRWPG